MLDPAGQAVLVPVLANHRFDEAALARYLEGRLPGVDRSTVVRQFQGGQSNPTYHLHTSAGDYVLRRKPAGPTLPSAHAVDREYRILAALAGTGVPVPRVRLLCDDPSVIGTIFFVMDHVEGRVYPDRAIPGVDPDHRRAVYRDMARTLAHLHSLDPAAIGLADYGRTGGYVPRQLARWTQQYQAARLDPEPAMDDLIAWLQAHPQVTDETTIAHGDYRLGNLLLHPTEPRVVAVLDWELSTLGHSLADLAYCALPWYLPPELQGIAGLDTPGLPSQADFLADYCRDAGRAELPDFAFFVAFSLFRWAAIIAGVYRRALDGTAADANAVAAGAKFTALARAGRAVAYGEPVTE